MSLVEKLLQWERTAPARTWLVQPVAGGERRYTFAEAAGEVRRIASAIQTWELPPGSRIAISGRNTAHWFLVDLVLCGGR